MSEMETMTMTEMAARYEAAESARAEAVTECERLREMNNSLAAELHKSIEIGNELRHAVRDATERLHAVNALLGS